MNQLLEWLSEGDLRSDGMAPEVADMVLENPHLIDDLYEGLDDDDDVVRGHTADALEKISRVRPDLIVVRRDTILQKSVGDPLPMVRWHLAMLLGNLAIYADLVDEFIKTLIVLLDDRSVFVRSWAISGLCIYARMYSQRNNQILNQIAPLQNDSSIAIRTRVRNAINLLTDPEQPFPKGWIKSEPLRDL